MVVAEQMRAFLELQPLYSKVDLALPQYASMIYPDVLELECPECRQARPFRDPGKRQTGPGLGGGGLAPLMPGVYGFVYQCTGCGKAIWRCWVEVDFDGGWVRKVGQLPPWSIAVSKDLERHLGAAAAELYKRARICMSESFGLGACAYMRRVLEDTIDPLLKLELEVKRGEGAAKEELDALSAAIESKVFKVKTEEAYRHAPKSIIVDGDNPLKLIHDQLSIGVHLLPEEDCLSVAMKLSAALEYVVKELNRQREEKAAFTAAVRQAAEQRQGS
jgi:hypothetical protein